MLIMLQRWKEIFITTTILSLSILLAFVLTVNGIAFRPIF